jgi:transcriptional regulator with XRE-family HTH domain
VLEVKRLRQEREWNQTELAYHAGLAPSVISQIENGKRDPTARTLRKLAEALSVEVADLFPKKAQAPLPLDGPVGGAGDPVEAAKMIRALASTAAELASVWNHDVEFYEQHRRSLLPYRTMEMGLAVEALYQHFWGALSVLRHHAESLGLDPDPATWEPQSKDLLVEAGSNIRALAELRALIERSAADTGSDTEDLRALREEFDAGAPAFLEEDPQWPEAIEKARSAAGIT